VSVPLKMVVRVVIRGEWVTVKPGTFEVVEMTFTDDQGNPTHGPLQTPAYHFRTDINDEYYGPLSSIQLFKLAPR
jgi:hypothetical protein